MFLVMRDQERFKIKTAQQKADDILNQAGRDAENRGKQVLLDARAESLREREQLLEEVQKTRSELRELERNLDKREDGLSNRQAQLDKRSVTLDNTQRKASETAELYERKKDALERALAEQREILHKLTGMDSKQAEELLLRRLETDFQDEIGARVLRAEEEVKRRSEERAREILATAIQRYAAEHTAESTVATVDIPGDDMKGRIIGREGRNIRAFEKATGVDVIVDDTPGIVVVSSFDGVRREIGKIALMKLIADGRIHPTRIEEVVAETKEEFDAHIIEL
ncbi:MAG: Rnase Y domain-containing protein, partial [Planctomycetia bacterium]